MSRTEENTYLDEVLADYMQRIDAGEDVDQEEFISEYPDLADDLRSFFELSQMLAEKRSNELQSKLAKLKAEAAALGAELDTIERHAKPTPKRIPRPAAPPAAESDTPARPAAKPKPKPRPKPNANPAPAAAAATTAAAAAKPTVAKPIAKGPAPDAAQDAKTKPAPAKGRKPGEAAAAGVDVPDEEERSLGKRVFYWAKERAGATGVSLLVHAAIIVALGLVTLAFEKEQNPTVGMIVDTSEHEEQELHEIKEIEPELELEELDDSLSSSLVQTTAVEMSVGTLDDNVTGMQVTSEIGSMNIGLEGMAGAHLGEEIGVGKGKGLAKFFGVESAGRRFVYVVDNSKSMNGGKFEKACEELVRSVSQMNRYQSFYVIFFSDTEYPLFHPNPAPGLVQANEENVQKLAQWVQTVPLILQTRGKEAMAHALSLRPDAIYLLTDGIFTDKAHDILLTMEGNPIPIHTIYFDKDGFKQRDRAVQILEGIAKKHNGTFRNVPIVPMPKK